MTEYINKADAMETLMQMQWHDEDGYTVDDADEKRKFAEAWVNAMPTIDIVHCSECKHWKGGGGVINAINGGIYHWCSKGHKDASPNWFCADGEEE